MPGNTPQKNLCPQCSKPLPPNSPQGLCPACLLKRGLETNTVGFTDEDQVEAAKRWTPPTVAELAPLFPELELLELIGRGGMGAVYKAREKQLDRLVALKILPPEIGKEESFAQRFAREAQAMAKLGHSSIVTIHSFGQRSAGESVQSPRSKVQSLDGNSGGISGASGGNSGGGAPGGGGLYFFIMEYVDGLSLRQLLDAGTVSPKEALAIVPQICDALQYAHDRGIVHRDIKPENILLNKQGQVKIADFGLAKLVGLTVTGKTGAATADAKAGSQGTGAIPGEIPGEAPGFTQAGEKVMGTPQYMAPEQIDRPREVDHRADIYSLGVVFYQMLTGELPTPGTGRFEPPSKKVLIDVRLDEVVLRALEREPARRYQQVSEVRTQVETIIADNTQADRPAQQANYGWEYRSKRTLWGLPLLHIAEGYDPNTGKPRQAKGIIAWGSSAKGVIAIGGRAIGIVAFGGLAVGVVAFGGMAMGLFSFGGLVLAALFAYGGVTVGPFAVGGVALGLCTEGGFRTSIYRLPGSWTMYASVLFYSVFAALGVMSIWLAAIARRHRPWARHQQPGREQNACGSNKGIVLVGTRGGKPIVNWRGVITLFGFMWAVAIVVVLIFNNATEGRYPTIEFAFLFSFFGIFTAITVTNMLHALRHTRPEKLVPLDQPRPKPAKRSWFRRWVLWPVVGIAAALVAREFVLEPFSVQSDAVGLGLKQDGHVFIFKLARTFEPGSVVVFRSDGRNLFGRVTQAGPKNDRLIVERSNQPPQEVPSEKVVGKAVFLFGRPATRPVLEKSLKDSDVNVRNNAEAVITMIEKSATTQPIENWKVTLPSGVTVEMIGVSENPSDGKPWWRPDGSPLNARPYSYLGASATPGPGQRVNEIAVRLANLPKEYVGTKWTFEPSIGHSGGGGPVIEAGDAIPELRGVAVLTPAAADVITIKLGVAAGPWSTLADAGRNGSASLKIIRGNIGVSFSPTYEKDNAVVVSVAHNVEGQDVRVIAIDVRGKELTPSRSTIGGLGNVNQHTCTFQKVRLSDIKEFHFQARPYEWATFKNVSLIPRNNLRQSQHTIFGPVIERELPFEQHTAVPFFIDFDSGNIVVPPPESDPHDKDAGKQWFVNNGVDASADKLKFGPRLVSYELGCVYVPVKSDSWESLTPKQIASILQTGLQERATTFTQPMPSTFVFQTREGGLGVLQIVGFTDNQKGTKIRYKLLKEGYRGLMPGIAPIEKNPAAY